MRQKLSITNFALATILAFLALATLPAVAADVDVKDAAPERYTVQKGDTLWGIAGKFLKEPWRWPEIWRMNRDQIKNPHLIYPGDVIVLDRSDGQWRLSLERPLTRLSPSVRVSPLAGEAIPSIPAPDIEPYLTRPLITGAEGLPGAAQIISGRGDARVVRGEGDAVYVVGLDANGGDLWHIYRRGRDFKSIDGTEILGIEQRFLGVARVERFGDVATLRIVSANEEILVGDRLIPAPRGQLVNYVPHSPEASVDGRIIAADRGAAEAGRGWIVTLDKGAKDKVDVGTVLAIYRVVAPIPDPRGTSTSDAAPFAMRTSENYFKKEGPLLAVPDERNGLLFVFRVFDRVSYAIVLNTTDPVRVGDYVRNP